MENQFELTVAKKRAREDPDWVCSSDDDSDIAVDVSALQQEIAKLRRENQSLKKMLKESKDQPVAFTMAPEMTSEQVAETAARLIKSLKTSISNQMVYKPSLKRKCGTSRVAVEIPNLSLAEVEAMMGTDVYDTASKGKKQVTAVLAEGDLYRIFGGLQKSLRYGSVLYLKDGLKMVYSKESRVLKCTGSCTMSR